jgi:hypothetical protein
VFSKVSGGTGDQTRLRNIFNAVRVAEGGTLTQAEFLRRLKAREHFEIRFPTTCRDCNGWKRLIPDRGKRGSDGKVNCKTCRGRGIEMRPHIVKWSARAITHAGDRRDPVLANLIRELGNNASAQVWFNTARSYHTGRRSTGVGTRPSAHAAYGKAIAKANSAWRDGEPPDSEHNRLLRHIIDEGLKGIADTAPPRKAKP